MPFRWYDSHPNNPAFCIFNPFLLALLESMPWLMVYLHPTYINLHVYNLLGCSSRSSSTPLVIDILFLFRRFDICHDV